MVTSDVFPTMVVLDIALVVAFWVVVCDAVLLAVVNVVTMLDCLLDDDDDDDDCGVVVEVSVEVPKVCVLDMTVLLSAGKIEPKNK